MAASAAATTAEMPVGLVNRKISSILQHRSKITKKLQEILNSATDAFKAKSYKIAAKYFKGALDSMIVQDGKTTDQQTIILTKYMLCACWLESTDAKDLSDALKTLEELERCYNCNFPMLYYAIGRAYFKLYRFNEAAEILKSGFAVFRNDAKFVEYCIPGTNDVIPESSRLGLVAALSGLNDQCASWRRPDAVCCLPDCSNINHTEGSDKNIFFGSPTFTGMVKVTCDNPSNFCTMSFHLACWKAKKEFLCSSTKMSDKEVLHYQCFTPNCVNGRGEHCTIKKIEIFDDNAKVKATIEPRGDDMIKHTKAVPPPKGAIKKQQQQPPKVKVISSEPRSPVVRNCRPSTAPKKVKEVKGGEAEEEEDLHDEQALRSGIEKLRVLRAKNFGICDDKIWRPNLPMYGSEYMLATAEVLPDPDFSDAGPEEEEKKNFIFSYFYTFLSNNGPVKLRILEEKWNEVRNIIHNCESILKHHSDIIEFLTQSLKFAIVDDYICTADKLFEAYNKVKTNSCEILKFFMENDIDKNSTTSSDDDEAMFNDIINHAKNNNSLPYPTIPEDTKIVNEALNVASDASMSTIIKDNDECTNGPDESTVIVPEEREKSPEIETSTNVCVPEISDPNCNVTKESVPELSNQVPLITVGKIDSPVKKVVQKRSHSPELQRNGALTRSVEKNLLNVENESVDQICSFEGGSDSPKHTVNGAFSVHDIENQLRCTRQPFVELGKFLRETKSTNDVQNHVDSFGGIRDELSINHSGDTDKQLPTRDETAHSKSLITENKEKARRNSEGTAADANVHSGSKNEPSLVPELITEVHKLSQELARSKEETEQLRTKLAQIKEANTTSRAHMLKKILYGQYVYNQSLITSKLVECRYDYNVISGIQEILGTTIGQTLPINGSELLKIISEIEIMAKNHMNKFAKLNEQLGANAESEQDVELQPENMPDFPKCDLVDTIRSAFGMYRMYQLKEFQKLQLLPYPIQQPQQSQPLHSNPAQNGRATGYYHVGQTPYINSQRIVHTPMQQIDRCLLPTPLVPQHITYGSQRATKFNILDHPSHFSTVPKNHAPSIAPYHVHNSSPNFVQPNFLYPVKKVEGTTRSATQETFSTFDQPNGSSSEQSKISPAKPKALTSNSEQQAVTAVPQLTKISTNVDTLQLANAQQALTRSTERRSPKENDVSDRNSDANHVNAQSDIDTRITEDAQNYDTYADPVTTRKKDETTKECAGKNFAGPLRKENQSQKTAGHSMHKLMRRLRSHYTGVLELDLLKSVECVRKKHNNSLSRLPMFQIVREVEKVIGTFQQKQLCGYAKSPPSQSFTVLNSTSWCLPEGERKRQDSTSSSFSVSSSKKEPQGSFSSKKQWEPVTIPNDTWVKESPDSECIICFERMLNDSESYTLQCKHSFHKMCIKNWYKHQGDDWVIGSCPMCRLHSAIDDEYPPLPLG